MMEDDDTGGFIYVFLSEVIDLMCEFQINPFLWPEFLRKDLKTSCMR